MADWDAIARSTRLNGSGKSNILDAICFVLGITNVSSVRNTHCMIQMRAQNQQDLIYKRDRDKRPVGLENCKQITVTRQIALPSVSKYLLNGHKSQQHTIQTLFQGVQLNINNPNFLIIQGRITKVLNMRPQEILGMVEEAAGTRMFEEQKDKAKKTMGKKEKRVDEITSLLAEEIIPKLDTLTSGSTSPAHLETNVALARLLCILADADVAVRLEVRLRGGSRQGEMSCTRCAAPAGVQR
ncbi:P-loop containing nucleoside triphosphate hydrolase protein [Phellopilus nigrolimitatus]|nr:P-loop containing nucleoside triphosphate hydrolase protein [Phellopilus nigrolimitatus]